MGLTACATRSNSVVRVKHRGNQYITTIDTWWTTTDSLSRWCKLELLSRQWAHVVVWALHDVGKRQVEKIDRLQKLRVGGQAFVKEKRGCSVRRRSSREACRETTSAANGQKNSDLPPVPGTAIDIGMVAHRPVIPILEKCLPKLISMISIKVKLNSCRIIWVDPFLDSLADRRAIFNRDSGWWCWHDMSIAESESSVWTSTIWFCT